MTPGTAVYDAFASTYGDQVGRLLGIPPSQVTLQSAALPTIGAARRLLGAAGGSTIPHALSTLPAVAPVHPATAADVSAKLPSRHLIASEIKTHPKAADAACMQVLIGAKLMPSSSCIPS